MAAFDLATLCCVVGAALLVLLRDPRFWAGRKQDGDIAPKPNQAWQDAPEVRPGVGRLDRDDQWIEGSETGSLPVLSRILAQRLRFVTFLEVGIIGMPCPTVPVFYTMLVWYHFHPGTSAKAPPGSPGSGRLGRSGKAWKRTMEARFFSSMFPSGVDAQVAFVGR